MGAMGRDPEMTQDFVTSLPEGFVKLLRSRIARNSVIIDAAVPPGEPMPPADPGSRSGRSSLVPFAIVRPSSTAEAAEAVRLCRQAGVAVVPRGGDTGLSGGTWHPRSPSIAISLERMNRIVSVDPDRWTITAEAGVTIGALQEAAAKTGRKFAPDWAARGTATLGGAISTNAGGNNVLRYGTMRDNVLGIEAVLADGRIWDGRRALRKDSSGYDLKQLFIGGEGTLGLVTSAVLRLVPATPHEQSALAAISGLDSLMPMLELAHGLSDGALAAFELMPVFAMHRAASLVGVAVPVPGDDEYCVLVKLASGEPVDERLASFLAAAYESGHVTDASVAVTADQESALWTVRDELSPTRAYRDFHHHGLKLDLAVPLDAIPACIREIRALAAELAPEALSYAFGHVGDGNLHLWVLPVTDSAVEPFLAAKEALTEAADAVVLRLGGTLSAEHGIGTLLRERIAAQKDPIEWELMRAVKAALDPEGLFNPAKTLPDLQPPPTPAE